MSRLNPPTEQNKTGGVQGKLTRYYREGPTNHAPPQETARTITAQHPNWKGKCHELQSISPHDQNWNRWKSEVGWLNRWSDSADLFCHRRWNLTHNPLRRSCQIPESTIQNMMRWLFHSSPEKYPKWFIERSNDLQTNFRNSVAPEERLPNKGRVGLDLSWNWSRSSTR